MLESLLKSAHKLLPSEACNCHCMGNAHKGSKKAIQLHIRTLVVAVDQLWPLYSYFCECLNVETIPATGKLHGLFKCIHVANFWD